MSLRLALHWAKVTVAAAVFYTVTSLPFTGTAGYLVGVGAAGGVCLIGIACAPTTRKDGSR